MTRAKRAKVTALARREAGPVTLSDIHSLEVNDLRRLLAERTAPTGTRLLVRRLEARQTMSSGEHGVPIHIPEIHQELDNFAEILDVGPDVKGYQPKQVIYMWAGAGAHLTKELSLIEEKEVMGVVNIGPE